MSSINPPIRLPLFSLYFRGKTTGIEFVAENGGRAGVYPRRPATKNADARVRAHVMVRAKATTTCGMMGVSHAMVGSAMAGGTCRRRCTTGGCLAGVNLL